MKVTTTSGTIGYVGELRAANEGEGSFYIYSDDPDAPLLFCTDEESAGRLLSRLALALRGNGDTEPVVRMLKQIISILVESEAIAQIAEAGGTQEDIDARIVEIKERIEAANA